VIGGPVRALFFDVGGTLIQPYPSVGAVYATVARRHGINTTADEMERAFRESWAALKGPGLTVSRKDWWRELVFRTIGQENVACFEELYETFASPTAWEVFPDVKDTLREARARGLHVGIVSNWDERLRPLLERIGLAHYFHSITVSCEAGAEKPQAEIFLSALDAAHVIPAEAAHLGDNQNEDVRGAEAVGMRALLLDRSGADAAALRSLSELWPRIRSG
jgi:putative hydrolase of the HAD superfamily